jgi:alpha-beta hydrolase superfamily lysophospholipase
MRRLSPVLLSVVLALGLAPAAGAQTSEPEPGSPEWHQRDLENTERMTGRTQDQVGNVDYGVRLAIATPEIGAASIADQARNPLRPVVSLSRLLAPGQGSDVYRRDWERDGRGVMVPMEYENRYGARIQGELWAPPSPWTDPVTGASHTGPYPAVIITTGSVQGYKELYWWAAQGLAEAGYVVMTYDVQGQGSSEVFGHDDETGLFDCGGDGCPGVPFQQLANFVEGTEDALDFFLSDDNPLLGLVDQRRIGLAGHSLGASAVTDVGNRDERVRAVVAWDNANLPADVEPRVPTMGQDAEAGFWPQPFASEPDPDAHNATFRRFREAGVDAMQVSLQGSTHLEWTYVPYILAASSKGERVAMHYTLAWFDRWLKGERLGRSGTEVRPPELRAQAADARARLTGEVFDDSADASAIGAGTYEPRTGNVPHTIEGEDVAEHLSFYFRSSYAFDGLDCEDLRGGC